MSGIAAAAIVTAIRERLDGTLSGTRAIAAGELQRGTFPGLEDGEVARRAISVPNIDVEIRSLERAPGMSLSELGNVQILRADIVVRCSYLVPTETQADGYADALRVIRALAVGDAEDIRQSLMFPAGLSATSGAVSTGIVTLLDHVRSEAVREDVEAALLAWDHSFSCLVRVAPAT